MLLREQASNKKNSFAFNAIEDDPTAKNYLAFAYAIAGVEVEGKVRYPRMDQALAAFGIRERDDGTRVNVDKDCLVPEHLKRENLKYKTRKKDTSKKNEQGKSFARVIVKNIYSSIELKFDTTRDAAKFFQVERNSINVYINTGKALHGRWIIRREDREQVIATKAITYILASNVVTQQVEIFKTEKECGKFIGHRQDYIGQIIKQSIKTKKGWKVTKIKREISMLELSNRRELEGLARELMCKYSLKPLEALKMAEYEIEEQKKKGEEKW